MKRFLLKWIVMVVSVVLAAILTDVVTHGFTVKVGTAGDILALFLGVGLLALVNATLGKLLKFLTFPISCVTLGLFGLVINAALFWAVGSLGLGFKVNGFLDAFIGSLLVSAINAVLSNFVPDEKDKE